jgi:hypothetical protein
MVNTGVLTAGLAYTKSKVGELACSVGGDLLDMAYIAEAFRHRLKSYGMDRGHRLALPSSPRDAKGAV